MFKENSMLLRRYDEMETTLIKLTGYDMEKLIELFAAGYTLQPPTYSNSLEEEVIFMDKELYEGDDVVCKEPYDLRIIDGYSGAFCECGHVLHIKTPRRKAFHSIKCPICGYIVKLYCGEIEVFA